MSLAPDPAGAPAAEAPEATAPTAPPAIPPTVSPDTCPPATEPPSAEDDEPAAAGDRETDQTEEESAAADDRETQDSGEAAVTPAPAATPPLRPAGATAPAYDLQAQPITIVIQLQPADGHDQGRPVLVSLRAGTQAPLFAAPLRYNELGVLPASVTALLQQLQLRALEQKRKAPTPPPLRPTPLPAAPAATPAPSSPAAPPANAADPNAKQLAMF